MDVGAWLRGLGLERYEQVFRDNEIDAEVLPKLTAGDLKDMGVTVVGHRRKLLVAIDALHAAGEASLSRSAKADAVSAPSLVAAAPAAQGERRQLTVMFVDLVGSMFLSGRLDPEEMREVLRAYQNLVADEVTRFEGHVAKYMGDGVLAYFGWPRAHEDEAERAVRAALRIVETLPRLATPAGEPLAARVGIATGLVVVGDTLGEGAAREEAVVGETPNLAARLQQLAEPGAVVVAENTRRLLGQVFELDDIGPLRLKGVAAAVTAFRIGPERSGVVRFEARQAGEARPMVGREQELALLVEHWRRARAGEGHGLLLVGEAGIGKSRLVRALLDAAGPWVVVRCQCSPLHSDSALWPAITQLAHAAGLLPADTDATKLAKLEALLRQAVDDTREPVALLAPLLGIDVGDAYPPPNLTPQQRRARTLEILTAQVLGLAERHPVLVLCEDIHWIDPTSLELIERLLKEIGRRARALLVLTCRPDGQPTLAGQPHLTRLTLGRLGHRAAETIAAGLAGKPLPEELRAEIIRRTDGVPLFVEELTKAMLESGLLENTGGRYQLSGPLPPLAIPASLQDSLVERLDRLASAKEVAQVAACLGRKFDHRLLAAVAAWPEPELCAALDRLVAAELLFRRRRPPEATYAFKHALVRDAAYGTLLKSRRQQLHARIARALEQAFPEMAGTEPELLAHHFTEAGLADRAVTYWYGAGRRAVARSAMKEAIAQLGKGLAQLATLPPGPGRDARELDLRLALGEALAAAKGLGMPETRQAYARAVELAGHADDETRLFPALDGLIICHFSRAELTAADELAGRFLELAERARDVAPQILAQSETGLIRLALGDPSSARRHLERALALYDPACHASLLMAYGYDPRVICLGYLSWTLLTLGYPAQARQRCGESMAEARRLSHPMTLAFALHRSAAVFQLCRNPRAVEATAEELLRLAKEKGFRNYMAIGRFYQGWAWVQRGQVGEGLALSQEALTELRVAGDEDWFPHSLALMAEAHHRADQVQEGLKLLDEALRRVEVNGERWFAAEVHRLRGVLFLSCSAPERAEASFLQAVTVAHEQGAKLWELRATTSLARLWRKQGKPDEARELLAPIYGWFSEGFDTLDLKDAKALLDELAPVGRPGAGQGG